MRMNGQTTTNPLERRCSARGFTLIEILVVIVVLGVLASVVAFAIRNAADGSENSSCQADRRIVEDAKDYYMASNRVDAIPATGAADADRYERTLVAADLLQDVSTYHDVAADGTITSTGVPCP